MADAFWGVVSGVLLLVVGNYIGASRRRPHQRLRELSEIAKALPAGTPARLRFEQEAIEEGDRLAARLDGWPASVRLSLRFLITVFVPFTAFSFWVSHLGQVRFDRLVTGWATSFGRTVGRYAHTYDLSVTVALVAVVSLTAFLLATYFSFSVLATYAAQRGFQRFVVSAAWYQRARARLRNGGATARARCLNLLRLLGRQRRPRR